MADEGKLLEPKEGLPWRYQHFVEGVATEEIATEREVKREHIARAFSKGDPKTGKNEVHLIGSVEAVDNVAEGIGKPGREIHKWYIGPGEDIEEEAKVVRPAMQELIREAPKPVVGDPLKFIDEALKLPPRSEEAKRLENGRIENAAKALEEFSQGGD